MSIRSFFVAKRFTANPAIGLAVTGVVLLAAPLIIGQFMTNIVVNLLIAALFAMSFNLLFGYTGMLSFGQAGFYGFAAYLTAMSLNGGVSIVPGTGSFIPAVLFALLGTVILAAIFGVLCVQRGDIFFAMLTLALSMMLYEASRVWTDITGGVNGMTMPGVPVDLGILSFRTVEAVPYYYFTLVVVVLSLVLMWRIVHSPYGELLKAIRENPERAEFVGMNVKFYQWTVFVISGFFAGLAGALVSVQIFVVSPSTLHWSTSAIPVVVTLIGGPGAFLGPVVGATVFTVLDVTLSGITTHFEVFVGAILIFVILVFPKGLVGTFVGEGGIRESIPVLASDSEQGDETS